jgi:hypothetical protein
MMGRPMLKAKPKFFFCTLRARTTLERSQMISFRSNRLPLYYDLCEQVTHDLTLAVCGQRYGSWTYWFVEWCCYLLTHLGIGHFLCARGRWYARVVLWKLVLFTGACVGIWTDELVLYYDLKKFQTDICNEIDPCEENRVKFMSKATGAIVATGAMLFQFSSSLSFFSAFAISIAGSPLFVFSEWLNTHLPAWIIFDCWSVAQDRLAEIGKTDVSDSRYQVFLQAVFILVGESRFIQFLQSFATFILAIMILLLPERADTIGIFILIVLIPFSVCKSFQFLVYFGEYLNVRDSDFRKVFCLEKRMPIALLDQGSLRIKAHSADEISQHHSTFSEAVTELEAGKQAAIMWCADNDFPMYGKSNHDFFQQNPLAAHPDLSGGSQASNSSSSESDGDADEEKGSDDASGNRINDNNGSSTGNNSSSFYRALSWS